LEDRHSSKIRTLGKAERAFIFVTKAASAKRGTVFELYRSANSAPLYHPLASTQDKLQ
jgi:hypothetical protein